MYLRRPPGCSRAFLNRPPGSVPAGSSVALLRRTKGRQEVVHYTWCKMKVLLIDDDRELVAVLTLALERSGFSVSAARTAATALALLEAERPDLVVLGTPLRAANAADLLAQLRRRGRTTVI